MCRKIDCYIETFSNLATSNSIEKSLLLLAVLDLIAAGKINREFIEISPELAEAYEKYCHQVLGESGDLAKPFYDLAAEPFWSLSPRHGMTFPDEKVHSIDSLKEICLGARLDSELFKLSLMEPLRRKLRGALITK